MTLNAVAGVAYTYIDALNLALEDYNAREGRKNFEQLYVREDGSTTTVTIVFTTLEPVVQEQRLQQPEWEFIGHKGVSPNDPDWKDKVAEQIEAQDIISDGAHTISSDTITSAQIDVHRVVADSVVKANGENDEDWANLIQDRD